VEGEAVLYRERNKVTYQSEGSPTKQKRFFHHHAYVHTSQVRRCLTQF
jgi:hypothetical protein